MPHARRARGAAFLRSLSRVRAQDGLAPLLVRTALPRISKAVMEGQHPAHCAPPAARRSPSPSAFMPPPPAFSAPPQLPYPMPAHVDPSGAIAAAAAAYMWGGAAWAANPAAQHAYWMQQMAAMTGYLPPSPVPGTPMPLPPGWASPSWPVTALPPWASPAHPSAFMVAPSSSVAGKYGDAAPEPRTPATAETYEASDAGSDAGTPTPVPGTPAPPHTPLAPATSAVRDPATGGERQRGMSSSSSESELGAAASTMLSSPPLPARLRTLHLDTKLVLSPHARASASDAPDATAGTGGKVGFAAP